MVRNAKKKALYEVIIRAKSKTGYEQLHPKSEPGLAGQETLQDGSALVEGIESASSVVRWLRKPRIVQLNAGRIEFSVPYQVGIAVLLGALLILVIVFRLGQNIGSKSAASEPTAVKTDGRERPKVEAAPAAAAVPEKTARPVSSGRNRIVIQIYQVQRDLMPAKEYFEKLGVATEIIEKNNFYYLVTKNGYDSPDKPGTDGYLAKQKIIELGAGYKAPAGYETFRKPDGTGPFNDAFAMRYE